MCDAIAVRRAELPEGLIERFNLGRRFHARGPDAEQELWFYARERWPKLPVWHAGKLHLYPWGNAVVKRSGLPKLGSVTETELASGTWQSLCPKPVEVLASYALQNGFWYSVPQGIRGVLVCDAGGRPHVYLRTTLATVYYRNMTRSDKEPVFVGEQI